MLGEEGGAELSVTNRVSKGWGKCNMLAALLGNKVVSGKVKARLYEACLRSCMLYESETWA